MEIFRFLSDIKNAEVTTNVVKEDVYPEINGTITLNKGIYSVEYTWWCRVYPMYKMEDYITTDDLEFEGDKETIEGLPIDNFSQFRQGLIDHGMKSVAESLNLDDSEVRDIIMATIPNHKFYNGLFGDKPLFATLSDEEKRKAYVQAMSNDITFRENDRIMKRELGWVKDNEEGVEVILTNAEIIEEYYK
jgi:hypothetical protein